MKKYHQRGSSRACPLSSLLLLGVAALLLCSNLAFAELSPRMKLMARRAAKVDALRNLSEIVYGLRLDASSTVGNFVLGSDVIRSRLSVAIQGAREIDYHQAADGTAEVTMEITLGMVETILGRKLRYDQETFEAIGYGAPPGGAVSQNEFSSGNSVTATGFGLAPNEPGLSKVEADLLGFRAAKNDALRNLAEKINRVYLTSESTVRDFSVQNDDIRTQVNSVLNGARVISEKQMADSRYEVIIETDLGPLKAFQGQR